jgi:hypothetical protein
MRLFDSLFLELQTARFAPDFGLVAGNRHGYNPLTLQQEHVILDEIKIDFWKVT